MSSNCLQEQVLVAAFPNRPPEVHVATLDTARRLISLKEAKVLGGGDIGFGKETVISLADAEDVDVSEGNMLAIMGRGGKVLAQLHLENPEDQRAWGEGIRAAVKGGRPAPDQGRQASAAGPVTEDTDDEVHLLQARSRQLQTQIGQLEAANERRDQQLQKMMRRLDGAMQMLVAVQDMCGQQRNVITAQKVAIEELTNDVGVQPPEEVQPAAPPRSTAQDMQRSTAAAAQTDATSGDDCDAEAEIATKTEQMLSLLQKADEMQRALAQMESLGHSESAEGAGGAPAPQPRTQPERPAVEPPHLAVVAEADEEVEEVVTDRLHALEEEKQRFEGMLRDSQSEQDELRTRLDDMRSLMAMLGMQPEDADVSDSSSDGGALPERNIELVMSQVTCSRSDAVSALKKKNNDVVEAIMELSGSYS